MYTYKYSGMIKNSLFLNIVILFFFKLLSLCSNLSSVVSSCEFCVYVEMYSALDVGFCAKHWAFITPGYSTQCAVLHLSRAFTVLLGASAGSSHIHNHRFHSTVIGSWHENSFPSPLNRCFPPRWRDERASPAHTLPSNFQGNDDRSLASDTIFPLKTRRIFTQK